MLVQVFEKPMWQEESNNVMVKKNYQGSFQISI